MGFTRKVRVDCVIGAESDSAWLGSHSNTDLRAKICAKSENKPANRLEAGKKRRAGIETVAFRHCVAAALPDSGAARPTIRDNGDQPATVLELSQQGVRQGGDRSFDDDGIERTLGGIASRQVSMDDSDVVGTERLKHTGCFLRERQLAFECDNRLRQAAQDG